MYRGVQPSEYCEAECACIEDAPKNVVSWSIMVFKVSAGIQRLLAGHHDPEVLRQSSGEGCPVHTYMSQEKGVQCELRDEQVLTGIAAFDLTSLP